MRSNRDYNNNGRRLSASSNKRNYKHNESSRSNRDCKLNRLGWRKSSSCAINTNNKPRGDLQSLRGRTLTRALNMSGISLCYNSMIRG